MSGMQGDLWLCNTYNIACPSVRGENHLYRWQTMINQFHFTYISVDLAHCEIFRGTAVPTKSDSDVIFCLQLLSKTLTCTLHLS